MKKIFCRSLQAFLLSVVLIISLAIQPNTAIANTQALPDCVNSDCNCSDFKTQDAAQNVLTAFEGDRFRLDGDKNGIACESLPKAQASAAPQNACPKSLLAQAWWYQSEPENLAGIKSIAMKVALRNKGNEAMDFSRNPDTTFQLWATPSINDDVYLPKYTINSAPSSVVDANAVFNYDLTIDVSDVPQGISAIAFRPVDKTFGSMRPTIGVIEDSTFECN